LNTIVILMSGLGISVSAEHTAALMKLLGHESMVTSQRYVDGAGTEHRAAAAQNPLYGLLE
jgi:hypothetical protein